MSLFTVPVESDSSCIEFAPAKSSSYYATAAFSCACCSPPSDSVRWLMLLMKHPFRLLFDLHPGSLLPGVHLVATVLEHHHPLGLLQVDAVNLETLLDNLEITAFGTYKK